MNAIEACRAITFKSILLCALSLSIGWGVRGDFGHEYGAMLPGALAAMAVCLLCGREDWRQRVHYFGMFGALGWAFGGSISYMQVIGFTHTGLYPQEIADGVQLAIWPERLYGFLMLFVIGFLWGGMGGAGTAFPAVASRERLTQIFRPLCWVFSIWLLMNCFLIRWLNQWESAYAQTWNRHESPLYWLDADWIQAVSALVALFLFDLWDRRKEDSGEGLFLHASLLSAFTAAGILIGKGLQWAAGPQIWGVLVQRQGDLEHARVLAEQEGIPPEKLIDTFLINWPQFFVESPWLIGIVAGGSLGACLYFALFGKFRSGASLLVHMAGGWLISFILLPVFGSLFLGSYGGLRMTPPRSDDWAGILGVFIGAMIWLYRNDMIPVVYAAFVSGIIGGLGFAGAAWLKLMMVVPGHPNRGLDADTVAWWNHWQSSNWHSFLEQTYGFFNGIGIAVAIGLLANRVGRVDNEPRKRPWTEVFAASFVLFGVVFLNMRKNPKEWVNQHVMPEVMKMPWFESVSLGADTWFHIIYLFCAAVGIYLLARHLRRPIPLIPEDWLGKGQLLYLVFVWLVAFMNMERALPAFQDGRLLTEGTIFINTILVTFMILSWPPRCAHVPTMVDRPYGVSFTRALAGLAAALLVTGVFMTASVQFFYGNVHCGHAGDNFRFGPKASWRTKPIEVGKEHL